MAVQVPAEEFVVEGAKMSCDKGSRNAVFKPPADRRMTILGGRVGIETDTSPEKNFEGDFGKCAAMSGKPCIKDFIDTWFLAEPSVSYSSGQAAPSNNAPPAVSPKEEGHLLLTSSILVCWRGGHITFSDSGQKLREFDPDNPEWIDERVHVVIRDRNEEPLLSAADGDNETSSTVGGLLALVLPAEDLDIYWNHSYDFTNYHAEIFLPIVFPDLSTERIFDGEYQEAIKLSKTSADEGSTRQDDMAEKVEQLRAQCNTACKLTYMVCYGNDAVEKYAKDLNDYFIALDDARQGREPVETEQAPERENDLFAVISKEQEREELLKTNEAIKTTELYRMTSVSNYGLWGKWYDSGNGWHRGIDICPGGNVHVIWPGELVDIGSAGGTPYYLSLFSEDLGVTITYMHLAIGTHADGTAFQVGDHFEIGAVLGTQSNRLTKGSHTHIEINQGVYRSGEETFGIGNGVIRPMSTDGEGMYTNLPLAEISEGVNMSINPYPYLDRIWKSRSQMQ